ncbi:hypothetical protein SEUCBS140593_005410 [Sporothrix eucalyptigena]|uniref:Alpha-methylacyl-CoA racemase n=1 Tax=Sporothrix eucalyptigena TaxID=1812306 RepID=A0ABP0BY42_9PEZI
MPSNPPLTGVKVVELAGLSPGPFCGQILSSYGASVLRIDRPSTEPSPDILTSYKKSMVADLKLPSSVALLKTIIAQADVLIDPYRPGVLERLGLDPKAVLLGLNPRLVVVRLTGFRRDGKYKDMAGHDLNYLAVSGVLNMLGTKGQRPSPPANMLADYAGGGLVAAMGVMLALLQRNTSGKGQVVEANMVDGAGYIGLLPRLRTKEPVWNGPRGTNTLDGGCPYYQCYECKDAGEYMAIASLEPAFFKDLLKGLGCRYEDLVPGNLKREDKRTWPYMREALTEKFREKTRKEWEAIFDKLDACVTPVLGHQELERMGFQHRPIVTLTESPAMPVDAQWEGKTLPIGTGGEETLKEWMGWQRDRDYSVAANGVYEPVKQAKSSL